MSTVVTNSHTPTIKTALEPERKCSDFRSVCNIVMTAVGLGILGLPPIVGSVGIIPFNILMVIVCLSALLMTHVFYRCMLLANTTESYAAVSEVALGVTGKWIGVSVVQVSLIGINATLLVLFGATLNRVAPLTGMFSSFTEDESRMIWVTIGCLLAQPFMWIKKISDIGLFSAIGVGAVFFLAGLTVYGGLYELSNNISTGVDVSYVTSKWDINGVGFALCILVFSFGSVPIIPSVYREMKNPENFTRVLCTSYAVIYAINGIVATVGYIGYAKMLSDNPGIDNVMQLLVPADKDITFLGAIASAAAILIVLSHIFVLFRPVADASQELCQHLLGDNEWLRKLSRTVPTFVILLIGLSVKNLSLMVLLVASVTVMIMCLQLPPILYARLLHMKGDSLRKPMLWVASALIVVMGFYATVVGLQVAVAELSKST